MGRGAPFPWNSQSPPAKLELIGEAEYDRGSSSWLIAGFAFPNNANVAKAFSHSPTERIIFRRSLVRNGRSTTVEPTVLQAYEWLLGYPS